MDMTYLKEIRSRLKLTKYAMAKKLGKSPQNYQQLENTRLRVSLKDVAPIRALAHEAGMSDTELLDAMEKDGKAKRPKKKEEKGKK